MLPTQPEGITRRIFADNFTQASFKLSSNHGFPCREQSSVALRTIMLPVGLLGGEGGKLCCPYYSPLLRDNLNRDVAVIKT